jgi:DNA-binding IclR family transcriptional regulator
VFKLGKVDEQIVALLKNSDSPLTLLEIAEKLGKPSKTIFRGLQKLFSEGKVECNVKSHTYRLAKE